MIKKLSKIGNSQGIILNKSILDLLEIKPNTLLRISTKNGGIFLEPITSKK